MSKTWVQEAPGHPEETFINVEYQYRKKVTHIHPNVDCCSLHRRFMLLLPISGEHSAAIYKNSEASILAASGAAKPPPLIDQRFQFALTLSAAIFLSH